MRTNATVNPFHLLGLPTDASKADIVKRGEELCLEAGTPEQARLVQKATSELITHADKRRLHELLEVPGTKYGEREWERFERGNKKNPVNRDALAAGSSPLSVGDFNLRALIGLALDGLLSPPAADMRPALENPPVPPGPGAPPVEVSDVIFG